MRFMEKHYSTIAQATLNRILFIKAVNFTRIIRTMSRSSVEGILMTSSDLCLRAHYSLIFFLFRLLINSIVTCHIKVSRFNTLLGLKYFFLRQKYSIQRLSLSIHQIMVARVYLLYVALKVIILRRIGVSCRKIGLV